MLGNPVFLDAFATLPKATVTLVMSDGLSVRMERFCPIWTDFREI
jgi:hypothetical protein